MIHIDMHVHSRMFDHVTEEDFRLHLRREMLGFIFKEFDRYAKEKNLSFDHTSLEVDGSIKVI